MVCDAVEQEAKRLGSDHGAIRVFDVCCGIGTIGLYLRKKLGTDRIGSIVGIGEFWGEPSDFVLIEIRH